MKINYLKHLLTALLLLCTSVTNAYDFEVNGIYYDITDSTNKNVAVTINTDSEYTGDVIIPETVTYNNVTYSVTSIGYGAFSYCTGLTSITIGNSVTSIASGTFRHCYLTSIVIPNSVVSIGDYAFSDCEDLTSIVIPNSVTSIGEQAFFACTSLTSIEIPGSVTSIGGNAFECCSGLTSVVIGDGVTSIGAGAFSRCPGLTSIVIPNSVVSIGDYAFSDCTSLEDLRIEDGESILYLDSTHGCLELFSDCPIETLYLGRTLSRYSSDGYGASSFPNLTSVTIGNSVTSIIYGMFYGCTGLTSIEIPNSVTSIGGYAFEGCTGLTSIEIPNSVTSIGGYAFEGCTGLTSIEIPNSVTSIGDDAFSDCTGLTSLEIPNSVTSIGGYAFYGCTGLASITVNSKTPPTIQYNTFDEVTETLYVPYGAKATYQAADYWKNIANIVEMEAPEYNLAVTAAGYASLYLSSAVEIPPGVEVYTATAVEGDLLKMQQVTGILPANTGAIVKADAGTYRFIYSDENPAAIEGNLLKGTEKATTVKAKENAQYYVLSKVDGVVGMYLAQLTDGGFLNNANKAYLELTLGDLGIYDDEVDSSVNGVQLGAGYRFDFGGTTGVSELKTANGNVKTIYDLTGRKIDVPTNGIYIINGKKILVR